MNMMMMINLISLHWIYWPKNMAVCAILVIFDSVRCCDKR